MRLKTFPSLMLFFSSVQDCFLLHPLDRFIPMRKVRLGFKDFSFHFATSRISSDGISRESSFCLAECKEMFNNLIDACLSSTPVRLTKHFSTSAVHCSFAASVLNSHFGRCVISQLGCSSSSSLILIPEDFLYEAHLQTCSAVTHNTTTVKATPFRSSHAMDISATTTKCFYLCLVCVLAVVPLYFQGDR